MTESYYLWCHSSFHPLKQLSIMEDAKSYFSLLGSDITLWYPSWDSEGGTIRTCPISYQCVYITWEPNQRINPHPRETSEPPQPTWSWNTRRAKTGVPQISWNGPKISNVRVLAPSLFATSFARIWAHLHGRSGARWGLSQMCVVPGHPRSFGAGVIP
jgi:hypothetical protein